MFLQFNFIFDIMMFVYGLLCLFGAFSIINCSLIWSKTYSLKAVLNVPSANISEPYQVWVDNDSGNSRIDFYSGIDRIYKLKDEDGYNYYKIHPETMDSFENKEVCELLNPNSSLVDVYEKNMYLPEKDFKYVGNETLNGAVVQKWIFDIKSVTLWYGYRIMPQLTYTVWVQYSKSLVNNETLLVPVRYEFRAKVNDEEIDYFRHVYSYFDDMKPSSKVFHISNEYECPITSITEHEPIDPLNEYIEPILEDIRHKKTFESFKIKHNKTYSNENEHIDRFLIFKNNIRFINSVNRQHRTFSLAVNHLADRADSELAVLFGIKYFQEFSRHESIDDGMDEEVDDADGDILNKFDWKDYGAVSSVKDQTTLCGSCYAFTVAATVESSSYVAGGCKDLIELSEQALVDCTYNSKIKGFGNSGCKGGSFVYTLYWIRNHGIPHKSEYGPYLAMEGLCHNKKMRKLSKIESFVRLKKNINVIKKAIHKYGPLVVGVNSTPKTFAFYSKGVYNDVECGARLTDMTHAMSLIGYGQEAGQEYWILKNSYGTKWGEDGYMKIAIKSNICGTMNQVFKVGYKQNHVEECFKNNETYVFKKGK